LRYTLLAGSLLCFFISLHAWSLLSELPSNLEIVPAPDADVGILKEEMHKLEALGFAPAGIPLELKLSPPRVVVPYYHREWAVFGLVASAGAWPPRIFRQFLTLLDAVPGSLSTFSDSREDLFPPAACEYRQLFLTTKTEELFRHHSEAIVWLHEQGIYRKMLDPDALADELQAIYARRRAAFLSAPLRHAIQMLLYRLAGEFPHRGSLMKQSGVPVSSEVPNEELQRV